MTKAPLTLRVLAATFLFTLLATQPGVASARYGDAELAIGTAAQSGGLRPGLHGLGPGLDDESISVQPPSVGGAAGPGTANDGIGGLGTLHGGNFGNYGAGSLGEPAPGGLGSLRNGGLGAPPNVPPRRR